MCIVYNRIIMRSFTWKSFYRKIFTNKIVKDWYRN